MPKLTIQSAAEFWLQTLETRKRKPAKPGTLTTFRSHLNAHITPFLGSNLVTDVGNRRMKEFVTYLASKDLSAKSVLQISNTVRQIVASVIDENGDQIYPRKWNSSFLDLPIVENQNQQSVTAQEIESAIAKATEADGVLMLLLAANGLRREVLFRFGDTI
jgi:site-specific recombinase XerD